MTGNRGRRGVRGPSRRMEGLLDEGVVTRTAIEQVLAPSTDQHVVAGAAKRGLAGARLARYTMTSNVSGALAVPSSSRAVTTMVSW